jgi:hypothetical protein
MLKLNRLDKFTLDDNLLIKIQSLNPSIYGLITVDKALDSYHYYGVSCSNKELKAKSFANWLLTEI